MILDKLERYLPKFPEEFCAKEKIISFIKENPRCFERSLEEGHITGSAWLLSQDGSQALLMFHAKLGLWVQPGGHCDGNPDVLDVALREAREESGIENILPVSEEIFDLDIHFIPANAKEKAHHHYDIRFLLQVASEEKIVQNEESLKLAWFGKDPSQLPTKQLSIVRMHKKWTES